MNRDYPKILRNRKQRIARRLDPKRRWSEQPGPMMKASNIHFEMAQRGRALNYGGIGAIHLMGQRLGLTEEIDSRLELLKRHLPYHESDHVLNLAYNALLDGQRKLPLAPGQPTVYSKLTDAVQEKICYLIANGASYEIACLQCNISRQTYHNWRARGARDPKGRYGRFLAGTFSDGIGLDTDYAKNTKHMFGRMNSDDVTFLKTAMDLVRAKQLEQ